MPHLTALLLASVLVFTPLRMPPTAAAATLAAPVQACTGCTGTGGTASASGGSCGGLVTITVDMVNGNCRILAGEEPGDIRCRQTKACVPLVTRTWSGLPANSALDFCLVVDGEKLCLNPKPSSGTGSGADTRASSSMPCSSDPLNGRSFSVESSACGLFASAQAKCSSCEDSF